MGGNNVFFKTAYEGLGLPLYIVGADSYEVIYINGEGKKLFGDITGRKCYEALDGAKEACKECVSCARLEKEGACHTQSQYMAAVGKYIDAHESIISLPDGSKARLCLVVDITEREEVRLENEAIGQAQEDMQHLIDIQSGFIRSAKSMMSAATLEGKMIFVNETMSDLLGYTQEEILGMRISDFHAPDVTREFKEKYIPLCISEGVWKGDSEILRKDGSVMPVRQIIFPISNEAGEIIATAAIMDDITKVQQMEQMNRYQLAIMDSSTSYIGVSDLEGNTVYHSPGAYRMLGYDPENASEWDKRTSHPDWYLQKVLDEGIPAAMRDGHWTSRGEVIDRHGSVIPVEQTIFPVFDENRQPMGVATIIQDITANIEQERAIEEARHTLRKIIDTVPSAIFWKDKNSVFLGANKQLASDSGFDDPDDIIGKSDYDFYPKEIADIYTAYDRRIFETGEEQLHFEEPFQGPDGITRWISTSKVLIRGEDGEPYALLGVYDDITKIKQNEMKLEEAIKTAEEASRAKSDFLSRMSHEIRTPMNAILGMTRIGKSANDALRMRYCFERIDSASNHLLGLINDILDISKIEANKLELVEEAFDFERMLENICNVINVKAEEKSQNMLVNIDENMPPEIIADEMRISQVVTNLLSNAIKFTQDRGTIKLDASCDGETEDGRLRLSVSVTDNGIGLSGEQIGKLFRAFEQAEAVTSRKYGGTGLGLAISKRIVEMMDGDISVTSKLGEGSTFTFTILVKKSGELKRKQYRPAGYGSLRVLVVDDAQEVLEYFSRLLGNYSISFDVSNNGADAVEMVATGIKNNNPYDILFIDYLMEGMDGIETTRRIKKLAGDSLNVIMVSQTEWNLIEDRARLAGVDRFISKPLFQSPILDCINQCAFGGGTALPSNETGNEGIFAGVRVLLAEDIEINREIVISLLEDTGIDIDCAANGEEALGMFSASPEKYHMILMDIQMPTMDGLEATRRIKALGTREAAEIPVIAMTANAFAEDIDMCKKAGMIDHVAKPIDIGILIAKIKAYMPQ